MMGLLKSVAWVALPIQHTFRSFWKTAGLEFCHYQKLRTEADIRGYSSKYVFLEISQVLQENTCVRVSF